MADELVKKVAESPARMVEGVSQAAKSIPKNRSIRIAKKYWGTLGPGLTTGAADDDPSGIATYSQTGAQFGFQYLWLALYSIPFMIVVQEMCARIALVTGRGISGVLKQHYSRSLVLTTVLLLFIANSINIGADIAGMVAATQLIVPVPYWILALFFTVLSLYLVIVLPYSKYANFLKFLTFFLFAYIITAFLVKADWGAIAHYTLVPSLSLTKESILLVTAILGTTISPYLFYWQAAQVIEQEKEDLGAKTIADLAGTDKKQIKAMRLDVSTGMILSNLVMFFIIAVTGVVLFSQGTTVINTAADAASALKPLAGNYAYLLFALGVIGTGLLAMPVLAGSASYAFTEAYSISQGLDKQLKRAYGFYGVIILAMFIGLIMNFMGINPMKALLFSAVINGLIAPILLTLILLVSNNEKVMGSWKNGPWTNILGWTIAGLMYLAGIATIISLFMK